MKISRNAPCPCGSGKKYKMCCGTKIVAAEREEEERRRAVMCGLVRPVRQKPFRRIGRRPVVHEPISIKIQYYDGRPEDRVRLQVLCDGQWQISGWPLAAPGEKRLRERSFFVDDMENLSYAEILDELPTRMSDDMCRTDMNNGAARKKTTVVLKETSCDGRYTWTDDAPPHLCKVESLALRLVERFHELCES